MERARGVARLAAWRIFSKGAIHACRHRRRSRGRRHPAEAVDRGARSLRRRHGVVAEHQVDEGEFGRRLAFIDLVLGDDADDVSGVLLVDLATRRSMQVVVTTALTPIPDRLQGVALLSKPFSIEQIGSVVASIAKSSGASRHEPMRATC